MKIIPATRDMLEKHCPGRYSAYGYAVVENGEVLGVSGVYIHGGAQVIFSWIGDEIKRKPRSIIMVWRMLLTEMKTRTMPILAKCDFAIPKSELMLLHFGFKPYSGAIWKYEGRQ